MRIAVAIVCLFACRSDRPAPVAQPIVRPVHAEEVMDAGVVVDAVVDAAPIAETELGALFGASPATPGELLAGLIGQSTIDAAKLERLNAYLESHDLDVQMTRVRGNIVGVYVEVKGKGPTRCDALQRGLERAWNAGTARGSSPQWLDEANNVRATLFNVGSCELAYERYGSADAFLAKAPKGLFPSWLVGARVQKLETFAGLSADDLDGTKLSWNELGLGTGGRTIAMSGWTDQRGIVISVVAIGTVDIATAERLRARLVALYGQPRDLDDPKERRQGDVFLEWRAGKIPITLRTNDQDGDRWFAIIAGDQHPD